MASGGSHQTPNSNQQTLAGVSNSMDTSDRAYGTLILTFVSDGPFPSFARIVALGKKDPLLE